MKRTIENIKDPLFRFFEREVNAGIQLLADVRRDMHQAMQICIGERKATNYHRTLIAELAKGECWNYIIDLCFMLTINSGIIPKSWRRYTVPAGLTVIQWITDFSARIKQLQKISEASQQSGPSALKSLSVWLGGLFIAEAYITATRQYVAQANSWSLEELYLQVRFSVHHFQSFDHIESSLQIQVYQNPKEAKLDDCSFGTTGLKLQGAVCKGNALELSTTISTELPLAVLRWIK
jgi:dynein heavy chain 1